MYFLSATQARRLSFHKEDNEGKYIEIYEDDMITFYKLNAAIRDAAHQGKLTIEFPHYISEDGFSILEGLEYVAFRNPNVISWDPQVKAELLTVKTRPPVTKKVHVWKPIELSAEEAESISSHSSQESMDTLFSLSTEARVYFNFMQQIADAARAGFERTDPSLYKIEGKLKEIFESFGYYVDYTDGHSSVMWGSEALHRRLFNKLEKLEKEKRKNE